MSPIHLIAIVHLLFFETQKPKNNPKKNSKKLKN